MTHAHLLLPDPTPEDVRAARDRAGLSQAQAAELAGLQDKARWSEYERGARQIDGARWALWLLSVGLHPAARLAPATSRQNGPQCAEARESHHPSPDARSGRHGPRRGLDGAISGGADVAAGGG